MLYSVTLSYFEDQIYSGYACAIKNSHKADVTSRLASNSHGPQRGVALVSCWRMILSTVDFANGFCYKDFRLVEPPY